MEDLRSDPMDESEDFNEFDEFLESNFNLEMEDLRLDPMDESEDFDEFDEFLESFDAPMYFDFMAVDNSRPDSPSWFCDRIGCNRNHDHVDREVFDRSFKHEVSAARAPTLKRLKPPEPDRARPTAKYAHSVPAKPAASERVGSAASRALVFDTLEKKTTQETCAQKQFSLKKADCHRLTSNKGKKPYSTNSKDLVLSKMPNSFGSICSISETISIVGEIPASSQTTLTESVENAMDANKENVPNTTCLEENCDKSNPLQMAINDCGNHHGEREKSKRMTKPKTYKLLTNERRIQREENLERKLKSEAKRETVSSLRCRDGMKNNQIGKRVQKPQPIEATVAHVKMVKLVENNLIKRKVQCPKPEVVKKELGEKSRQERVKGTSSKQSVMTQSLMAPRNANSSLSNRIKVIKPNACLPVKKSLTAQHATESTSVFRDGVTENRIAKRVQNPQRCETRLGRGMSVRLAPAKLITSHPDHKKNQIGKRVQNPHPIEARLDCGKSVRLARPKLITSHPQNQKENQSDERVQKPQASEARLANGKSNRLSQVKLITSNPQCQMPLQSESSQDKLGEVSHEELVEAASSKQPRKTQSLKAPRNAHSSSSHENKVITPNAHSHEELVKETSSKQSRKTQSLKAPKNAHYSSSHGNKAFTENALCQVKRSATAQGVTGSAIVSRYGHNQIDNRMQKSQRIEAGLDHRNMAGEILMTENSQGGKAEINKEKSHREMANDASSLTWQCFKPPSLIEARNASSSLTQETKLIAGKAAFSQWKKTATTQRLTASAIRCPKGSKKIEIGKTVWKSQLIERKLAHSKMLRFVGDNSIAANSQFLKAGNKDKLRKK